MSNKAYDFDVLEDLVRDTYKSWVESDDQNTRTEMFKSIKTISLAMLAVNKSYKTLDFEEVSYEYALYLFERIITGRFTPVPKEGYTRFPWQNYMKLNMRHVISTVRKDKANNWAGLVDDLGLLIDLDDLSDEYQLKASVGGETHNAEILSFRDLSDNIYKTLSMFYTQEEISRLYPLSSSLLLSTRTSSSMISTSAPKDVREFSMLMVSSAKRQLISHNIKHTRDVSVSKLKVALKGSVRSTFFLASLMNSEVFSKELFYSLDIDNLYRLVHLCGGTSVKVPTLREMDGLIGASVTMSKVVLEGVDKDKAVSESKKDLDLLFGRFGVNYFISKALESYEISKNEQPSSDPLIKTILIGMNSLNSVTKNLDKKLEGQPPEVLLEYYTELNKSMINLTDTFTKLKSKLGGDS